MEIHEQRFGRLGLPPLRLTFPTSVNILALASRDEFLSVISVPTAVKKITHKTTVGRSVVTPLAAPIRRPDAAPIPPPPAKATAGDLLKIRDFGKGVDWALVEQAVADRAR
jgi:hypothetical protein